MKNYDGYSDEELIGMLRRGEAEVADYLLNKYKPLVRRKARALYLAGGDQEDLLQEGMLGLFKAVQEYQPDKAASFQTFAGICVSRQMYSAVASASRNARAVLERLGLTDAFDYVADAGKIARPKPDPEVFLDCAAYLGVEPGLCVGFEDSQAGIEAIHSAGMLSVGIGVEVVTRTPDLPLEGTGALDLTGICAFFSQRKGK